MIAQRLRVLLIEDNPGDAHRIEACLSDAKECLFQLELADRLAVGLKSLARGGIDGILLDLGLPDSQGLDTFRKIYEQAPQVPIVIMTGPDEKPMAQGAVREGAQDYLVKGEVGSKELIRTLHYAVERKGAEEALRQSEQRYKKLLESVTDYIYSVQIEQGQAVATTHGWGCAAVTGYTPQEFDAEAFLWYRMVYDDDRQAVIDRNARLVAGADVPPLEHRIRHKNGSVRWIRNTTVVRRNEQGRVISYDGLIVDVTERKKAEEALKASEERYRLLFERNLAGILRSTTTGQILDCNESFAHILGFESTEEVQTHSTLDFYYRRSDRDALVARLREQRSLTNQEICFCRKDGSLVWVLANIIRSQVDHTTVVQTTVIDITERIRAREALKDSEALYHSLVESIPINMFRKDTHGEFTFANKRFCDTLGKPLAEIVGKTDYDFFPQQLADKYRRDDQRVMASGEIFEDTERHQTPSGEQLYVAVIKTPVYDAQRRVIGTQGMFWDVTATKWAEDQKAQLRVARAIQQKLLPTAAPYIANYDFGGASYPAEACSGDYFDYIVFDDTVDIVIGDVSGHGFGPALLAAVTHSCLRTLALARVDVEIEVVLAAANRLLLADTDSEHFVTLIFARLNLQERTLVYSNAGHPAGLLLDAAGNLKAKLADTGPLLGVFPQAAFPTAPPVTLAPGDLVLFVSDGVLEAMPANGIKFGTERMLEVVRSNRHRSAQKIVDALCQAALVYYGSTPQRDDITAVAIKVGS